MYSIHWKTTQERPSVGVDVGHKSRVKTETLWDRDDSPVNSSISYKGS